MVDDLAVTVLLRHDLPDGSSHFDWLLENPGEPGGRLIAFRVNQRIDQPGLTAFAASRMPDHRREYLTYEGEVSGGRGRVTRVAHGRCQFTENSGAAVCVRITFGAGTSLWVGRLDGAGDLWKFALVPIDLAEAPNGDPGARRF